jgi:hypothetical protein
MQFVCPVSLVPGFSPLNLMHDTTEIRLNGFPSEPNAESPGSSHGAKGKGHELKCISTETYILISIRFAV